MLGKWNRHHLTFPESSSTVLTFLDPSSSSINFPPRDRGSPQGWGGGGRGGGRRRRFQWWRRQQWCGFQHRLGMRWVWAGVGTNPKFWLAISWFLLRWNTHPIFLYFSVGLDPQALLNNSMGTDASNDSDLRSWEKWLIRGLKFGCLRFLQSFCSQQALSNMILWKSAIAIFTLVFFSLFCIFRLYKKMWQSSNLGWCMLVQHETVSASGHRLPMSKRFPIPIPSVGGVLRCCYTMFFHGFYSFVFQKFFVCFFPHPLDPSGRQWYWYFRGGDDTREPNAWGPWVLLPMRKSCRMPSKASARHTAVLFFAVYSHV